MPRQETYTIVLFVDESREYAIGRDYDSAKENYENEIGELGDNGSFRSIALNLTVTLPERLELFATIADDQAGAVQLTVG